MDKMNVGQKVKFVGISAHIPHNLETEIKFINNGGIKDCAIAVPGKNVQYVNFEELVPLSIEKKAA